MYVSIYLDNKADFDAEVTHEISRFLVTQIVQSLLTGKNVTIFLVFAVSVCDK